MKYGIIGTSWISSSFIEGAKKLCGAEIAAVYSRTNESGGAFAQKHSIPLVYTDLDEFAKGDFEAVYIASPNLLHCEHSLKMISAGKHVICEKPLAASPEEIIACQKKAKELGLIYTEAIMYMHSPQRDVLRNALPMLGNISSAHFDFSQLSSKYEAYKRGETPNIFNPALATGCLNDLGVYCVYPAVDLFGMPKSIKADAVFLRTGADGSGNASLNYGDKLVTLTYSKTGQDYAGSFIYGDEGTIEIESISKLINADFIAKDGSKTELCPYIEKDEIMGYEAREFEEFISSQGGEKYSLCSEMSLAVGKVMETIRNISKTEGSYA